MKIDLPTAGFAPYKVITGAVIVLSFLLFKNTMIVIAPLVALIVGKAHSLGAWVAMWRANKLTYTYVAMLCVFTAIFTYLGIYVWSLSVLTFVTSVLFVFHFLFDEFDLQEEKREWSKSVAPLSFFFLTTLYLIQYGGYLHLPFSFYFTMIILAVLLELIFVREITWHFINMKILQGFFLFFVYNGIGAFYLVTTILMWHYIFWFIYPVYKVNKYRPEDRDGLILILIVIVITSSFLSYSPGVNFDAIRELSWRYFNIITIVHILGTAPFGYYIGLPRPKYKHA